ELPRPRQTLIHVHADPDELGRVYQPELPIVSGSPQFAAQLRPVEGAVRAGYLANLRREPLPGDLQLGDVIAQLRERLPDDAVITNGAGNFSVWAHRF